MISENLGRKSFTPQHKNTLCFDDISTIVDVSKQTWPLSLVK